MSSASLASQMGDFHPRAAVLRDAALWTKVGPERVGMFGWIHAIAVAS